MGKLTALGSVSECQANNFVWCEEWDTNCDPLLQNPTGHLSWALICTFSPEKKNREGVQNGWKIIEKYLPTPLQQAKVMLCWGL